MDQPVGPLVSTESAKLPPGIELRGQFTGLRRLDPSHATGLFKHLGGKENFWRWTYMMTSGFPSMGSCTEAIREWAEKQDTFFYSVYDRSLSDSASEPAGMVSYMAAVPDHRRIEIGSVILGEKLVKSRQATEAFYLFIKHAIEDLGYQRVEWKANALNAPSRAAATRLGFTFEGIFRKHMVIKGRRRDTAWFSITDDEWPVIKAGFVAWLDKDNFDDNGNQKRTLQQCRLPNGTESLK
ncbi:Acyl-CoA N-acyltransferase [Beauveria bassiana ARSEF 2860]|uniref:Acyl-CoA N-acyltransferase n=1 Tax=Beauveria bassiana (strain ARSEF 2860) TaxID=655819 RepID=J4UF23_BEAB2|nr:Acyl-CoA N-acyltransferase [Beauveria bassiana ARSEF 2860]EJP60992.1 Acyl-CoA N-acyltransferase [Beauveria bassiana ARSEF 2860]